MRFDSASVQVPCSTSNLGPGFDTLGLALRLYTVVRVAPASDLEVRCVSPIPPEHLAGATAMVREAVDLFFCESGQARFGLEVSLSGNVPIARGLGFSSTVRVGLLAGLNAMTGGGWARGQLLELATTLEGHPDNASPAIFGGFTVSSRLQNSVRCLHFPVSAQARFVTLIPEFGIVTKEARKLLPDSYSKHDTVHNLNRTALLAAGLASGQFESLKGCFEDRVHQPYREKLIPELTQVIRAGEEAGAVGGWLSGSGSAIICLAMSREREVAEAMQSRLPESTVLTLSADNEGFRVLANS